MKQELTGRVALVTGGAKGIGRACCLRLAREGASVAVNYRTSEAAANETVEAIVRAGGTAKAYQANVADPEQVQTMVREVESSLGPVGLLVNNAGVFHHVSHEETTPDVWQETLDVNLTGAYHVTWAVKRGMIERRDGRIVNVSSISGLHARPTSIAYAVSKAGMIALTKSLAAALAEYNVRVNAVAPGLIDTEILSVVAQERIDQIVAATPISRLGRPEEIAELVYFLLSDAASFTTGQTLVASGGRVMLP